jgi:hypothetical protein
VQGDKCTIRFKAKTLGLPLTSRPASWTALLNDLQAIDMFSDLRFCELMDGISHKLIHGSVPLVLRLNEIVMKQRRLQSGGTTIAYLNYCNADIIFDKLKFLPRIGTPGDDFSFAAAPSTITGRSDIGGRLVLTIIGCAKRPLVLSAASNGELMLKSVCRHRPVRTRR